MRCAHGHTSTNTGVDRYIGIWIHGGRQLAWLSQLQHARGGLRIPSRGASSLLRLLLLLLLLDLLVLLEQLQLQIDHSHVHPL